MSSPRTNSLLILCAAGMLTLFSCNFKGSGKDDLISTDVVDNPNTASGKVDTASMPVFQFKETEHDFGKITEGETVSYSFSFKNTGKSDLVISRVSTSCGCTVPDYPHTPIRPGVEEFITIKFNSEGKYGFQHKTVTLVANTQPNTKVLSIKAMVHSPEE